MFDGTYHGRNNEIQFDDDDVSDYDDDDVSDSDDDDGYRLQSFNPYPSTFNYDPDFVPYIPKVSYIGDEPKSWLGWARSKFGYGGTSAWLTEVRHVMMRDGITFKAALKVASDERKRNLVVPLKSRKRNGVPPALQATRAKALKLKPKPRAPGPVRVQRPPINKPRGERAIDRSSSSGCIQQTLKKYATRPGPPYEANNPACRGKTMRGNDGNAYESKPNVNSIYSWRRIKV